MCGLYGIVFQTAPTSRMITQAADLMSNLAIASAERGTDATGIAHIYQSEEVMEIDLFKNVMDSYTTVHSEAWMEMLESLDIHTLGLMGHTRKKTIGINSVPNAHPYKYDTRFGKFVGAHNGTIVNWRSFHTTTAPIDVHTDSGNVLASLCEVGSNFWESQLATINGKFAFTMARAGYFYIAKNKQAPCYRTRLVEHDILVYASTEHILQAALALTKLKFSRIVSYKSDRVYKYKMHSRRLDVTKYVPTIISGTNVMYTDKRSCNANITNPYTSRQAVHIPQIDTSRTVLIGQANVPYAIPNNFFAPYRLCDGCKHPTSIASLYARDGLLCSKCIADTKGSKNVKV